MDDIKKFDIEELLLSLDFSGGHKKNVLEKIKLGLASGELSEGELDMVAGGESGRNAGIGGIEPVKNKNRR
jgi:hypothetical protein